MSLLHDFWLNFEHNLFKPLLLFFYMGFFIPLLGVPFEFPHVLYQGLTMYLLISIGWHGGEELATLDLSGVQQAMGFMIIGFILNFIIGCLAYFILRGTTRVRRVDAATVAGYYGSDSAGTFVTCLGVLQGAKIAFAPYMPVMLAVMEIPGCLVALFLVSRLRHQGMDARGNMPGDAGYDANHRNLANTAHAHGGDGPEGHRARAARPMGGQGGHTTDSGGVAVRTQRVAAAVASVEDETVQETKLVESPDPQPEKITAAKNGFAKFINWELLHEVFLNPGLYLLFGGIVIGYVSRLQGAAVTDEDDALFVKLFQGALCLFLLEMGMTACRRLRDLRTAGWPFIAFAIIGPNVFATMGILTAHGYSMAIGQPLDLGTYALFAVLCAAASYIAVPAVQRLAIPEASPTLPLAASLGCTFTYNVTIGIPVYIMIAKVVTDAFPVG